MKPFSETILVADDDPYIQEALKDRLESLGYRVLQAENGLQAVEIIERQTPHMAFLDIEMPGLKGMDVLREVRRRDHNLPVVMITAYGSIGLAVEAMKEGAYDFIAKPFQGSHIALVVRKALEKERLTREIEVLSEEIDKRYQLVIGSSPEMNRAVESARKAALTSSTVLLLGESGTGKEVFAHAIHNWSERRDKPFVAINCVGLSRELLESELFGHEKGAFTGANEQKKGKVELAHGGTVFLDEVGDISAELQTKLLRFLQEREFERVGGVKSISVDVRIIAATNRDLENAMQTGQFRADLFYRLNVVPITLPPLRQRREDIPVLASYFLQRFAAETKKHFTDFSAEVQESLFAYDWSGNVRELANVIERAVVLGQGPELTLLDLPLKVVSSAPVPATGACNYHDAVDAFRRELIAKTLEQAQGSKAAAARILGLQRTYLSRLIKTLGIE
jgi:DNA-binding NtrC family response regulator